VRPTKSYVQPISAQLVRAYYIVVLQTSFHPLFFLHRGACGRQSVHSFCLSFHLLVSLFFVFFLTWEPGAYLRNTGEPPLHSYRSVQSPNLGEARFETKIYTNIIFLLIRACSTFGKPHPVFRQRTSLSHPHKAKKSINHHLRQMDSLLYLIASYSPHGHNILFQPHIMPTNQQRQRHFNLSLLLSSKNTDRIILARYAHSHSSSHLD
jgi:hypothetical protein